MRNENGFAAPGPFTDKTWRRFYGDTTSPRSVSPEPSEDDELESDHSTNFTQGEEPDSQPQTDASAQSETVSGPIGRKWSLPPKGNRKPGFCLSQGRFILTTVRSKINKTQADVCTVQSRVIHERHRYYTHDDTS
jgi:hypothetical protein